MKLPLRFRLFRKKSMVHVYAESERQPHQKTIVEVHHQTTMILEAAKEVICFIFPRDKVPIVVDRTDTLLTST
jgi:hypothetical protein